MMKNRKFAESVTISVSLGTMGFSAAEEASAAAVDEEASAWAARNVWTVRQMHSAGWQMSGMHISSYEEEQSRTLAHTRSESTNQKPAEATQPT